MGLRSSKEARRIQDRFLEEYKKHRLIYRACLAVGVARHTPDYWAEKDKAFDKRYREIRDTATPVIVAQLEDAAQSLALGSRHPTMIIFLLKTLCREKYGDQIKHEGEVGFTLKDFYESTTQS